MYTLLYEQLIVYSSAVENAIKIADKTSMAIRATTPLTAKKLIESSLQPVDFPHPHYTIYKEGSTDCPDNFGLHCMPVGVSMDLHVVHNTYTYIHTFERGDI